MIRHTKRPARHKPSIDGRESGSSDLTPTHGRGPKGGARALGAAAVGALAIGALAIGALAIGRLVIGRARIRRLEIDELVVGRLRVTDSVETPDRPETEGDDAP